ncbi:hypothetical protein C3737_01095 [Aeromonas jandaei]|uniref:site-specific integrase n=1 Tax=Aeromonas TaxID=642 RepID=UPI000CE1A5E4|nr:site-specific integrase [Aeromonas jandaei]PPA30829.1 hypothetical protein C3737_01095 [Aeromonas jandaei]
MAGLSEFLSLQSREELEQMIERMVSERTTKGDQSTPDGRVTLGNGISLYKQKQSSKWYCRVHQPNNGISDYRQSTKTADLNEAKVMAYKISFTLDNKLSNGIQIKKNVIFKTIANEIIELYKDRKKANDGYYVSVIRNHLIPYFGGMAIQDVNERSIRLFWRQYVKGLVAAREAKDLLDFQAGKEPPPLKDIDDIKTSPAPSKTFKNTVHILLKRILSEAKEQGLISFLPDMKNKVDAKKTAKIEYWETDEIELIFNKLSNWCNADTDDKNKKILFLYCKFLYLTGVRTGEEATGITWNDIIRRDENGYVDYYCRINKGKLKETKKVGREVLIAKGNAKTDSRVIKEVLIPIAKLLGFKNFTDARESGGDGNIFPLNRPPEIWKKFANENSVKGTLYGFRHTYITNEIINEVPLAHIAMHVGNSVKMIEEHYSHATTRALRNAEIKRNKTKNNKNTL